MNSIIQNYTLSYNKLDNTDNTYSCVITNIINNNKLRYIYRNRRSIPILSNVFKDVLADLVSFITDDIDTYTDTDFNKDNNEKVLLSEFQKITECYHNTEDLINRYFGDYCYDNEEYEEKKEEEEEEADDTEDDTEDECPYTDRIMFISSDEC
jgi:hypothetical protein